MIDYIHYNVIKSLKRHWIQNIEQNKKLKPKDTETRKTKIQKDKN